MKLLLGRGDRERTAEVVPEGAGFAVTIDGHRVAVDGTVGAAMRVRLDGRPVEAFASRDGAEVVVEIAGRAYRFRTRDARAPKLGRRGGGRDLARGELHAPMPGLVVEVLARVGDEVEAGRPVVVVEAMKMQNAFVAPVSGRVTSVSVTPGTPVESGQLLLTVASEPR
ncbi:MAG TPA: biotin/lipoyl-containing protein [Candidatus Eisenbacteria bacterium]